MAKHVIIDNWDDFEANLRAELSAIRFPRIFLFRNFSAERIQLALESGTDRDADSQFWNADGFDAGSNDGMQPTDIIYAHRVNWNADPFTVLNLGDVFTEEPFDLTDNLAEHDAVAVYDSAGLKQVAINEHHFLCPPGEALLFVYSLSVE